MGEKMNIKALATLLVCAAIFLSMGCTGKDKADTTPTMTVTPTPSPSPTAVSPTPSVSAVPSVTPSNSSGDYIDPSLLDVSEDENDDFPELTLPTPGVDQGFS